MLPPDNISLSERIEALQKIQSLESVSVEDLSPQDPYTKVVRRYVEAEYSWVFLIKNSSYGVIIKPPPRLLSNGKVIRDLDMQWFGYYQKKNPADRIHSYIVISGATDLYNILEVIEEDIADDIIFNLDVFI